MKYKFLTIVILVFLFSACDDYLDVEPKGKVIPSKIEDYNLLLNYDPYVYAMDLMCLSTDDYQPYLNYIGDLNDPDNIYVKIYTWAKEIYIPEQHVSLWNTPYNNIYTCNLVIDEIDQAEGNNTGEKSRIKAEARVLRAYEYYFLINSFAPQYDASTAATTPGIFLVDEPNVLGSKNDERESIQEVYDFIIKDLSEAIPDLPISGITKYRPGKATAYGLLSRVYLQMSDYEKAKENADLALSQQNGKTIGDYTAAGFSEEVHFNEQYMMKTYYMGRQFWYGFLSDELTGCFDATNDARIGTIWDFEFDWLTMQPSNRLNTTYTVEINHCVSVPEMYLIKAECNARLSGGSNGDVLRDFETLRKNRIKNYYDVNPELSAFGQSDISYFQYDSLNIYNGNQLEYVLTERRREMALSATRWFDLKRLNLEQNLAKTIVHELEGQSYSLAPNSKNYVFPIPDKVLNFHPKLEQTDRD